MKDVPGTSETTMPYLVKKLNSAGIKTKHRQSELALISQNVIRQDNFLTCPKCTKEFSEEQQSELLAHMDMCWE